MLDAEVNIAFQLLLLLLFNHRTTDPYKLTAQVCSKALLTAANCLEANTSAIQKCHTQTSPPPATCHVC